MAEGIKEGGVSRPVRDGEGDGESPVNGSNGARPANRPAPVDDDPPKPRNGSTRSTPSSRPAAKNGRATS